MPEPELSRDTLLTMTSLYLRTVSKETQDELTKPAHLFAMTVYDRTKEAGIKPVELCYALCEVMSIVGPKAYQDVIVELGVVTLGALAATNDERGKTNGF